MAETTTVGGARRSIPRWGAWAAAAALAGTAVAAWMAAPLRATGGTFSAPLDDAYIHAVFARYFAAGRFYCWSPDAGTSLGDTSPLYPLVLAAGYLAGFREHWIMLFALLINTAGAAMALWTVWTLVRRESPAAVAIMAPLALAASGAVWWGVASGMEVGLTLGLLGAFMLEAERDWRQPAPGGPRWGTLGLAALAGLSRPDAILLTAPPLAGAALWHARRWGWRGWGRVALAPLPLLAVFGLYWLKTGLALPNSTALQSLFQSPVLCAEERRSMFLAHLAQIPQYFTKIYGIEAAALAATLWGLAALMAWARTWRAAAGARLFELALLAGAAGCAAVPATLWGPFEGEFRLYHGAFLMVLVAGARLAGAGTRTALNRTERCVLGGGALAGLLALIAGGLAHLPEFHERFQRDYVFLADSQIALGRLLRDQRPADPRLRGRVLLHEAGAIPYLAPGNYYDMVGLCSNPGGVRLTQYYQTDNGLFFEELEREAPEQWPDLSIVYRHEGLHFNQLPWAAEEIIPRVPYPRPGSALKPGDMKVLGIFRFPRELLRTGHAPTPRAIPAGWEVRDRLDIGDLADERAHGFRIEWPRQRVNRYVKFQTLLREGRPVVADNGRGLNLRAHARLAGLRPGAPVQIWARVWSERPNRYRVRIGEREMPELRLAPGELEVAPVCELPAAPDKTLELTLDPRQWWSYFFQVWILQPNE